MNTHNDKTLKGKDTLQRRQERRPATSYHDVTCAQYFTINGRTDRYKMVCRELEETALIYFTSSNDASTELIGYARPDRNKIVITVRRFGIEWQSRVPLKRIECFGRKNPHDR